MYENTNSSIDWKGLFLKVIIAFLIVLIAIVGYKTLKGSDKKQNITTTTTKIANANASSTFSAKIEKLKKAGESYFNKNKDKLPKSKDVTTMVTLNELIKSGEITALSDQNGKTCDGESSYVTAILEGNKANLVCGESSSYSVVYLGENDNTKTETVTQTTNNGSNKISTSTNYSTNNNSNNTDNTSTKCSTSACTPQVNVTNTTEVETNISINKGNTSTGNSNATTTRPITKVYAVSFNANGGTKYFRTQYVNEYDKAYNPGNNTKAGYKFKGWYLNGELFDFNTPITRDIELVAKYTKSSNYYDDDDYDYDYNRGELKIGYETSYVYTMGWFTNGTTELSITHTLQLPEEFEDIDNVKDVRISKIEFIDGITTHSEAETYSERHRDTFIYDYDGNEEWHSDTDTTNSLATIVKDNVRFNYSKSDSYIDIDDAEDDGFEVTWRTLDVRKQCKNPFSVNGVTNLCNYGIVYKVTWQYRYYA